MTGVAGLLSAIASEQARVAEDDQTTPIQTAEYWDTVAKAGSEVCHRSIRDLFLAGRNEHDFFHYPLASANFRWRLLIAFVCSVWRLLISDIGRCCDGPLLLGDAKAPMKQMSCALTLG